MHCRSCNQNSNLCNCMCTLLLNPLLCADLLTKAYISQVRGIVSPRRRPPQRPGLHPVRTFATRLQGLAKAMSRNDRNDSNDRNDRNDDDDGDVGDDVGVDVGDGVG